MRQLEGIITWNYKHTRTKSNIKLIYKPRVMRYSLTKHPYCILIFKINTGVS